MGQIGQPHGRLHGYTTKLLRRTKPDAYVQLLPFLKVKRHFWVRGVKAKYNNETGGKMERTLCLYKIADTPTWSKAGQRCVSY